MMSNRTHIHVLPALALLLLLPVLTRGVSAQSWKSCGTPWYEVRVPADWSCRRDPEGERLVASDPGEGIRFLLRSKPVERALPSDPALLKKLFADRLDLLNSPANVLYAVTMRDVAVETINGLRGAVAELSWAELARGEDGAPTLARYAGFALLAEGFGRRYTALILCPLARFTYNSALMNRVLNDIRAGGRGSAAGDARDGLRLDGVWELSDAESKYRMTLCVSGDAGTLTVKWRDAHGESFTVEQRVAVRREVYGLLAVGSNPAYVSYSAALPPYAADTLLFQRQPDGSWKVWARDDVYVKQWIPLHARS
jgi:hypothetical protein